MAANFRGIRLLAQLGKSNLLCRISSQPKLIGISALSTSGTSKNVIRKMVPNESFLDKNTRMERPMSPHLTIYDFPLPALMSGSFRATGFAMTGMTMCIGVGALVLPGSLSSYIEMLQAMNIPLWATAPAKMLVLWPLVYHAINGVRHLMWDSGRGYDMKFIYTTSYIVLATSLAGAAAIVASCS